jgi:hypothetical protein
MGCGCNKSKIKQTQTTEIPKQTANVRKNIIKRLWETSKNETKDLNVKQINKK